MGQFFADRGFPVFRSAVAGPKLAATRKTVAEWTRDLKGKPVEAANELIVADGTDEAYEAFAGLYPQTPLGVLARDWLNRHVRMVAWNNAVIINTAASYRGFLAKFPDSDLTATARKLEERLRNRPEIAPVVVGAGAAPQNVALTCPCNIQPSTPQLKKVDTPQERRSCPAQAGRSQAAAAAAASPTMTSWSIAVRRRARCTSRQARRSVSASVLALAAAVTAAATMAVRGRGGY